MTDTTHCRITHGLAWALACLTFPLIWVGGLVTTYGAGMAVPDWPNTFGYNLFLYPLESWLHVWDVFLEHSHRLIGATTGMVAIALAVALWRLEPRRWIRRLGWIALAAVSLQGLLGGIRVTENEVFLAKVHGCTAPLFFSLTVAIVAFTSRGWRLPAPADSPRGMAGFHRLSGLITLAVYIQIVLGAQLRHPAPEMDPWLFRLWVWLHVLVALALWAGIVALWLVARMRLADRPMLQRRARWLIGLFAVQLLLGLAAWVTHYNWPQWMADWLFDFHYIIVANGRLQATLTTAHVAVGSLLLVVSLSTYLWSRRLSGSLEPVAVAADEPQLQVAT